jgi:hypothetical protein
LLLSLALLAFACDGSNTEADGGTPDVSTADGGVPPRVCREGTGFRVGDMAFVDRTDAWGLAGINSSNVATTDLDGDGYADLIVNHGSPYDRTSGEVFLNRLGESGERSFVDHTAASGIYTVRDTGEQGRSVSLVRFGDVDNDGDVDLFTSAFIYASDPDRDPLPDGHEFLLNDGTGVFTLSPTATLIGPYRPLTSDAFFFDQNLDGWLDVAIAYWWQQPAWSSPYGGQPQLFRGDGTGAFVEVTEEVGMLMPRTNEAVVAGTQPRPLFGLVMCDLNDDGRMDMVGAAYGRMFNELFLADGDTFTEIGKDTLVGADERVDFSDDESFRCYCQANPSGEGCDDVPPPRYACPLRGWTPGQSDQPFMLGGNTFAHACGDFDNDGDLDLYEANIRHPDVGSASDPSEIIVNESTAADGLRFSRPGRETMGLSPDPPIDLETNDEGGQHNAAFDFDNDGRLDLLLALSPYPRSRGVLFHQRTGGDPLSFEYAGDGSGFTHACPMSTALADFDRDGDLDMVVGTYGCNDAANSPDYTPPENQPVRFYENVSNENNWIAIRLVGRGAAGGANRMGLGARVRVTAGGVTQTRLVTTASQNVSFMPEAWFGLGASCDIERVEVHWPNGSLTVQEHTGVLANYRVEIHEGEPDVTYLP